MRNSVEIRKRLLKSLSMMLDFYGMHLDEATNKIMRAKDEAHVAKQYQLLNRSFHNYLRITRILKSLGILGCEDIKFEFLNHLILETFKSRNLCRAEDSCIRFWIPTLRRREDVVKMDKLVEKFSHQGRVINRNFRDGWGDEDGENWSTQFYPDELEGHYTEQTLFEARDNILVADKDPYAELRKRYQNAKSNYLSSLRESNIGASTGNGGRVREFVDLSDDDDNSSYNSDVYEDDDEDNDDIDEDEVDGEDDEQDEEELGEEIEEVDSSMYSLSLRDETSESLSPGETGLSSWVPTSGSTEKKGDI
eukprot:CAMPEP_0117438428 /NCGR_PEP_ID=MMETSP0759-20121206/2048_1 /TAXON_ID=63605 /ORGANISM="Percolomonas cosmopolitus, Strain WS" /LENGTH=306 /DNA_ID=CAMNT_0005230119 /DNA_START=481 /DNA_END=1401 /DNA_ORIENTATION=+